MQYVVPKIALLAYRRGRKMLDPTLAKPISKLGARVAEEQRKRRLRAKKRMTLALDEERRFDGKLVVERNRLVESHVAAVADEEREKRE